MDPDGSEPVGKTRVCKGCIRMVFMKREHAADKKRPNAVLKYYGSLVRLKERIDVALPRFQEMIATIGQKDDMHQAHPDYQATAKIRKELLDDFALFDAISKKINKLPAHSQHQKQLYSNVAGSSPSLSSSPAPSASSPKPGSMAEPEIPDERFAELVVLEEQRRLVESYIDDANRKRKFDDVKSLKMSLDELDQEIAAIRGRK
ncbi:carboxypeptidase Y-deficient [Lunasporangiospora selenospora]|uniref:Carboxypeptidase Y-deficient n=1 Tax=Lunasporangiospora selenospora TaxID=979761 RepID=A0A9P6KAU3_9FUNG|nr:carboxypeptidase Y-deficient [Lunasporangiospora selenospora]